MIKGPKRILYAGSGEVPTFSANTKVSRVYLLEVILIHFFLSTTDTCQVIFHFRTKILDQDDEKIIDDSKQACKPMELIIGKKFKLEPWEDLIKTMRVGEIAELVCDKSIVPCYVLVSSQFRKFVKGITKSEDGVPSPSCCGMAMKNSIGHPDLDELMKNPKDLSFTIELLDVKENSSYEKELWQLSESDQLDLIKALRERGNEFYESKDYTNAAESYNKALGIIESLMLKEKPNEEEWNELDKMRIPFFLNLAQCKIYLDDHYEAIHFCNEVIKRDSSNVKAFFRRAKAHMNVSNFSEAKSDFDRVRVMDQKLLLTVDKLIQELNTKEKLSYQKEKSMYVGKLFT